jgi:hypothetical protein
MIVSRYCNRTEHFEDVEKINNVETRPCTLQLTNDDDLCDNLSEFYKMTQLQLQILLNKMKVDPKQKSTYDLLKYVQQNKNKLSINACKVELNGLREVHKDFYSSNINLYKNMNRPIQYDKGSLLGYCLADVTGYANIDATNVLSLVNNVGNISSNIFYNAELPTSNLLIQDANNYSKYFPIKVRENVNMQTVLAESKYFCTEDPNMPALDNNLAFIKLHCYLDNETKLKVKKVSTVQYSTSHKLLNDDPDSYLLKKTFDYKYDDKKIKYTAITLPASIYKFTYNFCNKIESYAMYNIPKFSMDELYIAPKIIKHNIDLMPYLPDNGNNSNVERIVNLKIKELFDEIKMINQQVDTYTSNQDKFTVEFQKMKQTTCPSIIDNNKKYTECMLQQNMLSDNYNMIESDKYYLKGILQNKRTTYTDLIDAADKMRTMKFTLKEINEAIENGIEIDYFKYADFVSNDNCIYLLL